MVLASLLSGCGGGDRTAPDPGELAIAKAEQESGDTQVGVAGTTLAHELRVVVTRGGVPAAGVFVVWQTIEGSLAPASPVTDADGISRARWALQPLFAQQIARASLDSAGPASVTFTAIATPDPHAWNTVLVGAGGNRFEPADLTIAAGETVNWLWAEGSSGHNVLPDDGGTPPPSGPPVDYPRYHSFTFETPGVYRYHCVTHGAVGGVGMSGTITVLQTCGDSCSR